MIFKILLTIYCMVLPVIGFAEMQVVTTTPDLAWMARQIGGKHVKVESLLNGTEDPHFVDAMPHFIAKVARADVFCLVGLDLEVGWAPKILTRSGNKVVQPGGKGYCETGKSVQARDVKTGPINRSMGDVHAAGNPHYHLGPDAFLQGGQTILDTLINVDTKNSADYLANFDKLRAKFKKLKLDVAKILAPIKDKAFMEYHREFSYFLAEYHLKNIGAVEKVPGVPPSAGQLARVSQKARHQQVAGVLSATTSPRKVLNKFEEMSQIPTIQLNLGIVKDGHPKDYYELQTMTAKKLVKSFAESR